MKKPEPMSLARFTELLDAYGGDPQRWPAGERAPAEALLHSDPIAAQRLNEARQLDSQLASFEVSEPSMPLRTRVLEIPIRYATKRKRFAFAGWRIAVLALVPCALGFVSGAWMSEPTDQDDGWNEVATVLLGEVAEEDWL